VMSISIFHRPLARVHSIDKDPRRTSVVLLEKSKPPTRCLEQGEEETQVFIYFDDAPKAQKLLANGRALRSSTLKHERSLYPAAVHCPLTNC
jgi:hypothetical protein